jgi:WD40 repeat protein
MVRGRETSYLRSRLRKYEIRETAFKRLDPQLRGHTRAMYSADSKSLVTADIDGTIKVWDVPPSKPLSQIIGVSLAIWLSMLVCMKLGPRLLVQLSKGMQK